MSKRVAILIESKWHLMVVDTPSNYQVVDSIGYGPDDVLISFQCSDLVRHFGGLRKKDLILPNIIDLECLDRQMSQDRKDYASDNRWKISTSLSENGIIDNEFVVDRENIQVLLEKVCELYKKFSDKDAEEQSRLSSIESRINTIIYERQALGIAIDYNSAKDKCAEIERDTYRIKNILQMEYRIYDPDNEAAQYNYLNSKGYSIIQSFLYSFKIRNKEDRVCSLFYELIRNSQDLDSLLYMLSYWGSTERTYPSYNGFGTITSRITLRQPSLQNLRKKNRSVIKPDEGFKFLYIDYSQFEAGILACLSDDDLLIEKYNQDIYYDLASKVLNDLDKRGEAKIIFYRYIYGDTTLQRKAIEYFNQYTKLKDYQRKIHEQANSNGRVGTTEGNYRICSEKNCSWALSHVVQATASLIYKKAVIRVKNEIPDCEFLVPMHDGTLYQIGAGKYEQSKEAIEAIYKAEFEKMFPKIKAKVNSTDSFS